jgi:3-oxoacyl-[acyl-carrier protein] reductase
MVCGASRGIGAAIASSLAAEEACVALVARSSKALKERAEEIKAVAVTADISSPEGPSHAVEETVQSLGGLDILVVNGAGPPSGRFAELDEAKWQVAINGTLMVAVRLLNAALPFLGDGRDPAILIVLSSSVREPIDGLDTSNVLRPGLAGLVKSLAAQLPPIRVNGLLPGKIKTDRVADLDRERAARRGVSVETVVRDATGLIPLGRYGDPAEIGRVATFLCSPAAAYVTGVNLAVDGGMIRGLP